MTSDEKLTEIERLLLDSLHTKVTEGESLTSHELTLITRWLKLRDSSSKGSNKPIEPIITHGATLPFIKERLPFREAVESLEDVL